jgi:hypothetical protein
VEGLFLNAYPPSHLKEEPIMLAPFFSEHWNDENGNPAGGVTDGRGIFILWQNGPLGRGKERKEPNGAFVETVIAAAKDRLEFYQASQFACQENEEAILHLNRALLILDLRTRSREARTVEDTHEV